MSLPENLPRVDLQVVNRLRVPNASGVAERISLSLSLILDEVASAWDPSRLELGVILADDDEIRRLNDKHRNIDSPTDTLSFPVIDGDEMGREISDDDPPVVLGDVVLGIETIARQAAEREMEFTERFSECLVHGILHLLGWDHEVEADRTEMEALEDRLVPRVESIMGGMGWEEVMGRRG